jgi:hypothetical protein
MSDPNTPNLQQESHHLNLNPQPEPPGKEAMSTPQTLTGIFFEPGRVFEALRVRPRFLVAGLVIVIAFLAYTVVFYQRVPYETVVRTAVENAPQTSNMPPDQKERVIEMQSGPVFKGLAYASPLIGVAIFMALGGALYLLGTMVMARSISYKQAISVWTYSSLPPTVIAMILNIVLVSIKSPDDYDPAQAARRGLVRANLGLLVDPTAHPVLGTALGSIDLLSFYGLFLAALGLRKVARLSTGSAWTIVLIIWVLGVILRIALATVTGGAM